ncbi:MAG: lamin tail domain-containing protein [Bacteroidales bacterium]|nr:lamin tail domain-containing protein [Bacteroidales bacterium]
MKNKFITFGIFLFFIEVYSQIAEWPLTTNGLPNVNSQYISAGIFKGGSGIGAITFGSNGAYASGWTVNTSIDTSDYYQISISPHQGYKLILEKIEYSERRSLSGIRSYELRISKDVTFSTYQTIANVNVPDNDLERDTAISGLSIIVNQNETLYLRWYGYSAESGSGTWRFNDNKLKLYGTINIINPNDNTTIAKDPVQQVPGDTISSTRVTPSLAKKIFSFVIKDSTVSDNYPTNVSYIIFKNAYSNNWQHYIKGAFLKKQDTYVTAIDTIIEPSSIKFLFSDGTLSIPKNSEVQLDLYIYLQEGTLKDNDSLKFYVDYSSFDSYLTGSAFSNNFQPVFSNKHIISVVAKKINIIQEPLFIIPNNYFSLKANVTDIYNNIDVDYNNSLHLSVEVGNYTLSPPDSTVKIPTNGYCIFNVMYPAEDIIAIKITDVANNLQQAITDFIYSYLPPISVEDHFDDGEIANNPPWFGNKNHFIVTPDGKLNLFTTTTSSSNYSFLSTPLKSNPDSMEWQILINLNLSPSNNNNVSFYLISNNANLTKPLKGYYIKIGEDGSADAIKLYYQDSLTSTLLTSCTAGAVASNPNVRIKVIRNNSGMWKIYTDYNGTTVFNNETNTTHNNFFDTLIYTGIVCKYTSSNAQNKFFFDDIYAGPVIVDTIPPQILDVVAEDSVKIRIVFNEAINSFTAQNVNNYIIDNGIGNPQLAILNPNNPSVVNLFLSTSLIKGKLYSIAVSNITDQYNNVMPNTIKEFVWYEPQQFDVIFNEIMADPTPIVQLPECEYIELYNRSQFTIDIKDWQLVINNNVISLPSYKINPNSYLLLSHPSSYNLLSTYGPVLPVFTSTTILTNAGATLQLKDSKNNTIHFVAYNDSWYKSSAKKEGGWSLELIDPQNPCGEENNWSASKDPKGGTPGKKNSIYSNNKDNLSPDLMRAVLVEPDTLLLYFSESVLPEIIDTANFVVDNNIGHPVFVNFADPLQKICKCLFNASFNKNQIYKVTVLTPLKDCAGNISQNNLYAFFGIADTIKSGDVLINEVLTYPQTGGSDYIELFNNTNKLFNLKDLYLLEYNSVGEVEKKYTISQYGFYLFPQDYVVLTNKLKGVTEFYYTPYPKKIVEMSSFPSLSSTSCTITLANKNLEVIDQLHYSEDMHYALLTTTKGVALERINPNLSTNDKSNWHSASEQVGYGTPTYKNSQYYDLTELDNEISIEPEIFSPDMDGYNDVLFIKYKFSEPGYTLNITLFDTKGRVVKKLVKNSLCGTEGYYTWDGITDYNTKAPIGIYVIYIEIFNLEGKLKSYKKTCVVANKLR